MLKNRFLLYTGFIFLVLALAFSGCAKRGSITGGPKDTIPPVMVSSSPRNMTTNFKGNEIRINFDEYVKIKDASKQLIISPPMKYQPDIVPNGSASKYIRIKIKDTLQPNTTYSFNFGQSITDNNEGNPYSQFKFVFSTGSYIDSLSLNGMIKDAYTKETDNFVTVMLYEANETFNDSTIYKERPRYVTNTLDSMTTFSLQNLKAGRYYLFAMKDKGSNYKYDPKVDKIAFLKDPVTVPNDTLYQLELFQEQLKFKPSKPSQASSNRLYMGYEGNPKDVKVEVQNAGNFQPIPSVVTNVPDKDSVQIWLPRKPEADSLKIAVTYKDSVKSFITRFKELKAVDSLGIDAAPRGNIGFRDSFVIKPTTPLVTIDSTKISLTDKDSVAVKYSMDYDAFNQRLTFDFEKKESEKYNFTLLPGALVDFYGKENDTLNYKLSTKTFADYGNMHVQLIHASRFPLILQLTDEKGKVKAAYYSKGETDIDFDALEPGSYILRVIYDDNGNGVWDSGNYMEKRQPEEVIYHNKGKPVDLHANWDWNETFDLSVR